MALLSKIDSNVTGLRMAEEISLGVISGSPVWNPIDPNSYPDFGGSITTVARDPINPSRQRKKGTTTDLDATGGFIQDLTQTNLADLMQGVMFADLRRKAEFGVVTGDFTSISTTDDSYNAAAGLDVFRAGDLIFGAGFGNSANNGLKNVVSAVAGKVVVTQNLVNESPAAGVGSIAQVGFQFGTGEVDIVAPGGGVLPRLTRVSGTKDFTQFGLVPGETIFVGGDAAGAKFTGVTNNGFCRVRSVGAAFIEFDKTSSIMVSEVGTGKTIQVFFGTLLKNESDPALIKRRSYHMERSLGAPETTTPTVFQYEYVIGAVANEWSLSIPTADKVTVEFGYIGITNVQRTIAEGPLAVGTRPTLVDSDAFNTSSDISRSKLAQVVSGDACPSPLFNYLQELTLTISNNVTPNKAVGVLGAFEMTTGTFEVGATATGYFSTVDAIKSVRNNVDCTLEVHLVKANAGISIDYPLISLGDARAQVEKDAPISIPLEILAASASKISPTLDHTMSMVFFNYLPSAADL
jgi:hypothetical protein